jgi:hypothetical protein
MSQTQSGLQTMVIPVITISFIQHTQTVIAMQVKVCIVIPAQYNSMCPTHSDCASKGVDTSHFSLDTSQCTKVLCKSEGLDTTQTVSVMQGIVMAVIHAFTCKAITI